MDRAEIVHQNFLDRVTGGDLPALVTSPSLKAAGLDNKTLVSIFKAQIQSRQLDRISLKLQQQGEGFYTIGSSGHEGNAAIAAALRVEDPAFLHYRDAAFQIARAYRVPGEDPLWDMLLSFTTSSEDPISGGRHKVLGSKTLNIPPQTSTIASHLPKAVGTAYSIGMAKQNRPQHASIAKDAIVLCSFGDASLNHSTAQGAMNTAGWTAHQGVPLPLMFVCEDNGIGISVKSPRGWVEASLSSKPNLRYVPCNGLDVVDTFAKAKELSTWIRQTKRPGILHMTCVRLYGHAGPDVQQAYLTKAEIEAAEAKDPLLFTAARMIAEGVMSKDEIIGLYAEIGDVTEKTAEKAIKRPKLKTARDVMASIIPPKRTQTAKPLKISLAEREKALGKSDMRAMGEPQHLAKMINLALADLMLAHDEIILAGEDIGRKGGVYGVTQKLQARFGQRRVIDTLLDEQAILGMAIGMGQNGFVAIPEIQFLAYVHNAEDQIRGEAATLSFFSNGQFANPMVIRIAGLGYQRGFGGHFHNDNSLAVLRDIPGLIIACPSNGVDAALMLRECVRLAREEQRICVFLEPIALYMTRDLHQPGDMGWTGLYPQPETDAVSLGDIHIEGDGTDIAIVTYANGYYLSRKAQKKLLEEHGINARVIDIRWIAPLPEEALIKAVTGCKSVLIVDECRITGSQSEGLMALFTEKGVPHVSRIAAEDCFIATGPAYGATLPSVDGIIEAVRSKPCRGDI